MKALRHEGSLVETFRATKVLAYRGLDRIPVDEASAGEIVAVAGMLFAAGPLSSFIAKNPTVVMLALGFLMMIGMTLIADGFGVHVPKGYIYAAMAFSAAVEILNIISRRARDRRAGA